MGVITILWFLFVFSLCFGHTYHFFGSITTFGAFYNVDGLPLFRNEITGTHEAGTVVSDIPGLVFAGYQGMFGEQGARGRFASRAPHARIGSRSLTLGIYPIPPCTPHSKPSKTSFKTLAQDLALQSLPSAATPSTPSSHPSYVQLASPPRS